MSRFDQYYELKALRAEFDWVKDTPSQIAQQVIDRLDNAYQGFFKRRKSGHGFPKFRARAFYNSIGFKQLVSIEDGKIKLPKLGLVAFHDSRPVVGKIKTATVKKELGNWYICIQAEQDAPQIIADDSQAVGIDVGIACFASLSDGSTIESPLFLEPYLRKMRVLQRKRARQKKGSNNRAKTSVKIALLHRDIRNRRQDFLHKASSAVADSYSMVFVEDLQIQNMVKLNSTLSRRMLDSGWGLFGQMLEYKSQDRGQVFGRVNPAYTSQTCSRCKAVDKQSRLSQSQFVCTSCGYAANADINAASNIMGRGTANLYANVNQ